MKIIYFAMSNYNKNANDALYRLVCGMTEEQFLQQSASYYPAVADTLLHIINSDIKWLERLSAFRKPGVTAEMLDGFLRDEKPDYSYTFNNLDRLTQLRTDLDNDIGALIEGLSDNEITGVTEIQFGTSPVRTELWRLLLQWFNHQIHHRGQLSVQLDLTGTFNDYSSTLDKI